MQSSKYSCYLSDQEGHALCPNQYGAINYREMSILGEHDGQLVHAVGACSGLQIFFVCMRGYITILNGDGRFVKTVSFRQVQRVLLPSSPVGRLAFETTHFCCNVFITGQCDGGNLAKIVVYLQTAVKYKAAQMACCDCTCCPILQTLVFSTCINVECSLLLRCSDLCQYIALGNGDQKIFTNANKLEEYGSSDILAPDSVSYYSLYVNGLLQPKATYELSGGHLRFLTEDAPAAGDPITIVFVAVEGKHDTVLHAINQCYVTASDGIKKRYTNADAWPSYSDTEIPDPQKVSYWNLFVNGVLQPKATYRLEAGVLELCEAPTKGQIILIESVTVYDGDGQIIKAVEDQFLAFSNGSWFFTDCDASQEYNSGPIASPLCSTFQFIFVNGVIQPQRVYEVRDDCIIFCTAKTPKAGMPVMQQAIRMYW